MQPPSRTWPDGRPVGGRNGYPTEFADYKLECQACMVVRLMRGKPKVDRRSVFDRWKFLPGVTNERVQRIWKDGSEQ